MQEAWNAFHIDKSLVSKYMKPLIIGRVKTETEIGSVRSEAVSTNSTHDISLKRCTLLFGKGGRLFGYTF